MNRFRYRIRFAKTGAMRFTGHLDLQRAWERLLRRADVPVAYSQGFHPHPKIRIGAALPLGVTGENELVDIETGSPCDAEKIAAQLNDHAPPGIRVLGVTALDEGSAGLEKIIAGGEYSVEPLDGAWPKELRRGIERLLNSPSLPRERRGKAYDLRPRILALALDGKTLRMRLSLLPEATGRPDEVLAELGAENVPVDVRRERLIEREG
jgi:radical SAM-linked protein